MLDSEGVCGYVLGALDSTPFYAKVMEDWFPKIREQYPEPDPNSTTDEDEVIRLFYNEVLTFPEEWSAFPSHLHIDLIARAQGKGLGTIMLTRLLAALKAKGSKGVHLEMSSRNDKALRFYQKFGFLEIARVHDNGEPLSPGEENEEHTIVLAKTL